MIPWFDPHFRYDTNSLFDALQMAFPSTTHAGLRSETGGDRGTPSRSGTSRRCTETNVLPTSGYGV